MELKTVTLEDRVEQAKRDKELLNQLISQFKPFIASVIQKRIGKYLRYGSDDELSIGLLAFDEAIRSFDKDKGKFLSFARIVIINRLIDYYRKRSKEKTVALQFDPETEDPINELIDKKAMENYSYEVEEESRKTEIIEYSAVLKQWDINFENLVKVSPKHKDLRDEYIKIAKLITERQDLLSDLKRTQRLPVKELEKIIPIHRKKIERGRIYIIAVIIAIINKFSFIEV